MKFLFFIGSFAFFFNGYSAEKDTLRFQLHGLIDGYSTLGKTNEIGKIPYLVSSSNLINAFWCFLRVRRTEDSSGNA